MGLSEDASAAHEDIDAAELIQHCRDHVVDVFFFGHVRLDRDGVVTG